MIKLSLKGLVKFMTANASQQRKILHDFKNPDPEGAAQTTYYREARNLIRRFVRGSLTEADLLKKGAEMELVGRATGGASGTRLGHNGRAIRQYVAHFRQKQLSALPDCSFAFVHNTVRVSIHPELHIRERRTEKLVRLEFSEEPPKEKAIKVMTQAIYEAASTSGLSINPSSVALWDVPRGRVHTGARMGARIRSEIQDACLNIESLWAGI